MEKTQGYFDKIIIGGGASGMMAAIISARKGFKTALLEKTDILGKKLYATGNGKCNFTNLNQDLNNYFCEDSEFVCNILEKFSAIDTIEFFRELGIEPISRNGYIYPASEQAKSIVLALKEEIKKLDNLDVFLNIDIANFKYKEDGYRFAIHTNNGVFISYDLIVATALSSSSFAFNSNFGLKVMSAFYIPYESSLPSLVNLRTDMEHFEALSGVRCNCLVTMLVNGKESLSEYGQVQFNSDNISGIPIFQLSGEASKHLAKKDRISIKLDILPSIENDLEESNSVYENSMLYKFDFYKRLKLFKEKKAKVLFNGLLNDKLAIFLLRQVGIPEGLKIKDINQFKLEELDELIHNFIIPISKPGDIRSAQTSSGGVLIGELSNELEVKKVPGLFFIGELIDVYGKCGGYNLQLAWSTGYIAGNASR